LLIIGYTHWGYDGQFIIAQWKMKEAARESCIASLPDKAFLRLSLTDIESQGKWEDGGRECWYKGHLYDVIRQSRSGDTTWLFCLDDDNEERLIRQSGELTKASQEHSDKQSGHTLSLSIGDLACDAPSWKILPPEQVPLHHWCGTTTSLPVRYTEIVLPPPKG
jgi:hypothetical protein